jgi:hypothetical protein
MMIMDAGLEGGIGCAYLNVLQVTVQNPGDNNRALGRE